MSAAAIRLAALVVLGAVGCAGDTSREAPVESGTGSYLVTPSVIALAPGGTQQIGVSAGALTLSGFASGDSCVARVSRRAGDRDRSGNDAGARHLARERPDDMTSVPVTVSVAAVLRLTVQSITTGTPLVAVDPNAVRGTISVALNVDAGAIDALERLLASKAVGAAAPASDTGDGAAARAGVLPRGGGRDPRPADARESVAPIG